MNRIQKNKKGDIPITILVIGVFIVCTLTLLNFYFEGFKDTTLFEGVLLIKEVNEFSEDIKFYDNLDRDSLSLTGLSQEFERDDFKFQGKLEENNYILEGSLYEKEWLGVFEGKRLVYVKYGFPG